MIGFLGTMFQRGVLEYVKFHLFIDFILNKYTDTISQLTSSSVRSLGLSPKKWRSTPIVEIIRPVYARDNELVFAR